MYLVDQIKMHWKKILIVLLLIAVIIQLTELIYPSMLTEAFAQQDFLGKLSSKKKRRRRKKKDKCPKGKKGRKCRKRLRKKKAKAMLADTPGGSACADFVKNLRAELMAKQSGEAKQKEQDAILDAAVKVAMYEKREAEVEAEIAEIEAKIAEKQAKTKEEKEAAKQKIAAAEAIKKFSAALATAKQAQMEKIEKSIKEERSKEAEKQKKLLAGSCQICECAQE